ncbi:MAG: hypothetical protein EOM20_13065 [Spartobacteria bacterium]|nr:hypothetical protein [Spartobacteria bacterium]
MRVDSSNDEDTGFRVTVLRTTNTNRFRVIISSKESNEKSSQGPQRQGYFILCKKPQTPSGQDFRQCLRGDYASHQDVLTVVPLKKNREGNWDFVLDAQQMDRAYLFVDYAVLMFDGGFYYCINLSTYKKTDFQQEPSEVSAEAAGP